MRTTITLIAVGILGSAFFVESGSQQSAREALQSFNHFIGQWKGTGTQKAGGSGFWTEKLDWSWQFKDGDAWLNVKFDDSKYFAEAELHYVPRTKQYRFVATTTKGKKVEFAGELDNNRLTLERTDDATKEKQRLVFRLLHNNRFLYNYYTMPEGKPLYQQIFQVGATKEGVAFAGGDSKPECIVSGGLGTIAVSYNGQTYFVCCTGCRDEFNASPEMYIKEYNEKKQKQQKK